MNLNRCSIMSLAAAITLVGGCQSSQVDRSANMEPESGAGALAAVTPEQERGEASPGNRYEEQRVHEAMRGLEYETGRVRLDADQATLVVPRPDVSLAAVERQTGVQELMQRNDVISAIGAFTRAVIHDPADARSYTELGRALMFEGESKDAEAAFRTALDLDPAFTEAGFQLGALLQMTGRNAEAVDQWLQVVSIDPNHALAHSRLAIELYYASRYEQAWLHVHAAQRLGAVVPPQFLPLLSAQMAEPAR